MKLLEAFRTVMDTQSVTGAARVLGHVLSVLADRDIIVLDMVNKSRNEMAYNIIDVETALPADVVQAIAAVEGGSAGG